MALTYDRACRAIQGGRSYQEDAAAVWPDLDGLSPFGPIGGGADGHLLAVLADGMGGHKGGALASQLACHAFLDNVAAHAGPVLERLAGGLEAANDAIARKIRSSPHLAGMGTTLVGLLLDADGLNWISVGDSPLYLWRKGDIALVNEDHSLAPVLEQMVADGRMSEDEAATDGRRHMLRSAVTGEGIDMIDASRRPLALEPGDCIVLASDGLDTLAEIDIAGLVGRHRDDGAATIANALLHAVEAAGNPYQDNTTVVVICVPEG